MDENTAEITVRGMVVKIHFQSPTFCAGRLQLVAPGDWPEGFEGQYVSFAGSVSCVEQQTITLRGSIDEHPKYGKQLKVSGMVYELPVDVEGLAEWLANHPDAVGIGRVRAHRIVETFGATFPEVLRAEPERIASVAGVSIESIHRLRNSGASEEEFNRVATKLVAWGLTDFQTRELIKSRGAEIVEILEDNPYVLLGEIAGFGFRRVDDIAQKMGIDKQHPGRVQAGVTYALTEFLDEGSTCPTLDRLTEAANKLLALDNLDAVDTIYGGVSDLLADESICGERLDEGRYVSLKKEHSREQFLHEWLRQGDQPNRHFHPEMTSSVIDTYCGSLDGSQLEAIYRGLQKRFSVISGPAGAGKTFTLAQLIRAYEGMGKTVALCAPTGKAARRMTQVAGVEAKTIHRLLDYHPQCGFRINASCPLAVDVVIVDEFSMCSVDLTWHLAQAITSPTAVVFVGDHNQLPPVGPGAILRDCLKHKFIPATVLRHVHRQAGSLLENCGAILDGRIAPTVEHEGPGAGPWYIRDGLAEPGEVLAVLEKLFVEILPERFGFDPVMRCQFLTPIHKGPLGTLALNALFQKLHQRRLGVTVPEMEEPVLMIGDKVIMTKNNYQIDVMNGHQGIVVAPTPGELKRAAQAKQGKTILVVDFEGRRVVMPKENESQVKLAYAITPHKYQGSEIPCAIVVAHRLHSFMHHRNWLYTAATRARQTAIFLTDGWSLKMAARRIEADKRETLLDLLGRRAELIVASGNNASMLKVNNS